MKGQTSEAVKREIDVVFPIETVVRRDGTLNEDRMLARVMDRMAELNGEYGYIAEEDVLLGVSFVDGDGEVLAVLRFETKQEYEPGQITLDTEDGAQVIFK